jgi:hypothetical protein
MTFKCCILRFANGEVTVFKEEVNSLERVRPSATLHDAMVAVDASGIRIVIVVDEASGAGTLTEIFAASVASVVSRIHMQ